MKPYKNLFVIMLLMLMGCRNSEDANTREVWKQEIMDVEKSFNDMAQEKGLVEAFAFYAAEDGVIRRNKK